MQQPPPPMNASFNQNKFIFIAGHHRSGTSLLHKIIRDHPEVSGFCNTKVPEDEGQHLQTVFRPAQDFGGPGKYIFNLASHMDEKHYLANAKSAKTLFNDWSAHWETNKEWLTEKSPPNIVRTRFLQKLFPSSLFIAILRHPIAVAYATRKWSKTDITSLLDHTLMGYEVLQRDLNHIHNHFSIKYEELIDRPQEVTANLFKSIGLPPTPLNQEIKREANAKYFRKWEEERDQLMSSKLLHHLEDRCNIFGYSLVNLYP